MNPTEKTAEEILKSSDVPLPASSITFKKMVVAMHQFADQRYTREEVLAIMEKVEEECFLKWALTENIDKIDLTKFLTK